MEISEYVINAASAIVAMEYIDCGFQKKYRGARRWIYFAIGCIAYFLTVTTLNWVIDFESVLGFFYGFVLVVYAFLALEGKAQDFLMAGVLWVLIAMFSTYAIFSVLGIVSGKNLQEMLQINGDLLFYASLVALVVKFSMGKIVTALLRKQTGFHKRENWIVAGAFMLMTLLAMGLFCLEVGELGRSERQWLTIGILVDETGIVVFLVEIYHRLGKYQQEELEKQYREKREEERKEGLLDMYRVGREINHWRHDMQGALGVLYRMQKNGKYEEVENYMEKLYGDLKNYPELPQDTGNEGLDAALMKTIPKCREKGIHFCYVVLGKPWEIDSMVLGNLMDNLLSNGMEACFKVNGTKEMELMVRSLDTGLEIYLENSIEESVMAHNPKLTSCKPEKEKHGFGMESIYHIVEEYEGTYEYWEEEKAFCQRIYLSYKQNKGI